MKPGPCGPCLLVGMQSLQKNPESRLRAGDYYRHRGGGGCEPYGELQPSAQKREEEEEGNPEMGTEMSLRNNPRAWA